MSEIYDIEGVIWDLDHTLYSWPEEGAGFAAAALEALQALGAPGADSMTVEKLKAITDHEYRTNGSSYIYFEREYGVPRKVIEGEIQKYLSPVGIEPCTDLPRLFAANALRHAINTHANPQWSARVLVHLGLTEFFPETRIVHACDHGFQGKATSRATHEAALAVLGCEARLAVMVDDNENNLRIPKEMGMRTVLVGDRSDPSGSHIDAAVARAADVFRLLGATERLGQPGRSREAR